MSLVLLIKEPGLKRVRAAYSMIGGIKEVLTGRGLKSNPSSPLTTDKEGKEKI